MTTVAISAVTGRCAGPCDPPTGTIGPIPAANHQKLATPDCVLAAYATAGAALACLIPFRGRCFADAAIVNLPPKLSSPGLQAGKPGFRFFLVAYAAHGVRNVQSQGWCRNYLRQAGAPTRPVQKRFSAAAKKEVGLLQIGCTNAL